MRLRGFLWLILLGFIPVFAHAQREKLSWEDLQIVEKRWPNAKRTSTGLRTVLLQEGHGETAKPGDMIAVLYTGALLNGKIFDKSKDPEHPFKFRLGRGMVIDGWEEGIQLMRPGEKRLFIIPFELGYGTRGNPPGVPPSSTLIFEVELLSATPEAAK